MPHGGPAWTLLHMPVPARREIKGLQAWWLGCSRARSPAGSRNVREGEGAAPGSRQAGGFPVNGPLVVAVSWANCGQEREEAPKAHCIPAPVSNSECSGPGRSTGPSTPPGSRVKRVPAPSWPPEQGSGHHRVQRNVTAGEWLS